eukprot:jgi/Ulvmu1/9109/UM005_0204.1
MHMHATLVRAVYVASIQHQHHPAGAAASHSATKCCLLAGCPVPLCDSHMYLVSEEHSNTGHTKRQPAHIFTCGHRCAGWARAEQCVPRAEHTDGLGDVDNDDKPCCMAQHYSPNTCIMPSQGDRSPLRAGAFFQRFSALSTAACSQV